MNALIKLLVPAKQALAHPAMCVYTPDLKAATSFYVNQLGFSLRQRIPHVVSVVSLGSFTFMLQEIGAKPARFEHAQRPIDCQVFQPRAYTSAATDLALIAQKLLPKLQYISPKSTSLVWQEWQAWELSFKDVDHNTLHLSECGGSANSMFF